jgi:hypothetical protein
VDDKKVLRIQRPDVDNHILNIGRKGESLGFSRGRGKKLACRAAGGRIGGGDIRAGLIAALGLARWRVESSGSRTRIAAAEVGVQSFAWRQRGIERIGPAEGVEGNGCRVCGNLDASAAAPNARFIFSPTSSCRSGMHMANLQKALGLSIPSGGRFFMFLRCGQGARTQRPATPNLKRFRYSGSRPRCG